MFKERLKKIFSKIGFKLLAPYLFFSFFVFIIIIFTYYSYRLEINNIKDSQQKMAEKVSEEIDSFIASAIKDLKSISKNIDCIDCNDFNNFLAKNLFSINPAIYSVHIINQEEKVINNLHRYTKSDHQSDVDNLILQKEEVLNFF